MIVTSFGADFSIGPNMEVYGAHGVTGLFAEGGPNLAEDMGALKSWMLSKMAWDVSLAKDWEKLMSEFLDGCASNAPRPSDRLNNRAGAELQRRDCVPVGTMAPRRRTCVRTWR